MSAHRSVTVIMPIRNEGGFIDRSLGAVIDQDFPHHRLQILVADGRSTDDTRARVQDLARRHADLVIEIVDNPGGIVPTGMNAALSKATGDVIVRVDGHTIVERDYLRRCLAALERTGAECVGGRMDAVADAALGRAVALATSSPFGVGGARFHYSPREEEVDTVMNQAARAGATIVKPASHTFYGGYAGYFQDPDGHLWEIAWNPQITVE